ncbi:hypothetical protein SNEBB_010401 [Seison nebaliae]|nr:hypothetical protein SNEBB_010401 [Seison nebaliae]
MNPQFITATLILLLDISNGISSETDEKILCYACNGNRCSNPLLNETDITDCLKSSGCLHVGFFSINYRGCATKNDCLVSFYGAQFLKNQCCHENFCNQTTILIPINILVILISLILIIY